MEQCYDASRFVSTIDEVPAALQPYYRGLAGVNGNKSVVGDMYYTEMLPYFEKWYEQHGKNMKA